ncbi:MAG: efflux RND transporter periplasmic adaptor subunit [Steroidobacteraceae bacterium]
MAGWGLGRSVALLGIGVTFLVCSGCGHGGSGASSPPQVEVAPVVQRDVRIYGTWVATLEGYVNAQIEPHVTGYLVKQDYREGSFVAKGEVLFEIDPRPFQAALDAAKAQLAEAEAKLGNAKLNVQRDIPEAKVEAIPQMQLESDTHAELAAQASVEAGKAAVEQAALNLGFTKVRSFIAGIAGLAQSQVGNLVTPSTVLTGVSDVDPIKAYFPVSGAEYLRLAAPEAPGAVSLLSGGSAAPLQLILSDGRTFAHGGHILFADRQIDPATGTIRIVAAFPNPGNLLRPGEYGKIRAVTEVLKGALLVPQRAVTQLQGSDQVAVVGRDDKITIRSVETGERVGSMWVITRGLAPGERVVAEGTQKVADGMAVTPTPYRPQPSPQPSAG